MRFVRVRLRAPRARLPELSDFYERRLGLPVAASEEVVTVGVGETQLEFVAGSGAPFYHFALVVPGNRFERALPWARANTALLANPGSGDDVFDFDAWNARACYFHDRAGNIVELIAHHGVDETDRRGDFYGTELVGFSELGLVGDPRAMADSLAERLGLELWDGTLDAPGSLAFVGERARTLILAPERRGWLPTGRP